MMLDESFGINQEPVLDSIASTATTDAPPLYNETVFANPINEQTTFNQYNTQPAGYQQPIDADPVYNNGGLIFSKVDPIIEAPVYSSPISNNPVYSDTNSYQTVVIDTLAEEQERAVREAQRLADLSAAAAAAAEAERLAAELRQAQWQSLQDEIAKQQAAEEAARQQALEQQRLQAELMALIQQQEAEKLAAEAAQNELIAQQRYEEAEKARLAAEEAERAAIYNRNMLEMQQLEAARLAAESAQKLQQEKERIAAEADAERAKIEEERLKAEQAASDANQVMYTMQPSTTNSVDDTPIRTTSTGNPEVQRTNSELDKSVQTTLPTTKVGANLKPVVIGLGIIALTLIVAKFLTKKSD